MGEGWCNLHGGRSLGGFLPPRYKHGRYGQCEVLVTSEKMRGECVVVHDATVQFDERGRCLGIMRIGTVAEIDPPRPLRQQHAETFRRTRRYPVTPRRRGQPRQPREGGVGGG